MNLGESEISNYTLVNVGEDVLPAQEEAKQIAQPAVLVLN